MIIELWTNIARFAKENPLAIGTLIITLYFIYHYVLEKKEGVRLSGKYRDAIFETQSKIFLNASQHLILGHKDLAIKELESAVSLNQETLETYFALGKLFRSNGEIDKAISIHRSIIVKEGITEDIRVQALKELAIDFDRGGFIQKAVDTYKDVLKINPDQIDVLESLCRITELVEDWNQAFDYRLQLSKISRSNQSETLSHIQVKKAEVCFEKGDYQTCRELLEEAFQMAPSVSAKILKLKLDILNKSLEDCKSYLNEVIQEHPDYTTFILEELNASSPKLGEEFEKKLKELEVSFLDTHMSQVEEKGSVVLARLRLLYKKDKQKALDYLNRWQERTKGQLQDLNYENILFLIELDKKDEALEKTKMLLTNLKQVQSKYFCESCGYNSDDVFWRCPQCHQWETIKFRWKV